MRKIIIGDVHGCLIELQTLISKLDLQKEDELVFVGDLLDKGPNSIGVWRYVHNRDNFNCEKVILVWGNHEDKHYRYYKKPKNFPKVSLDFQIQKDFIPYDYQMFDDFVLYHHDPLFNLMVIHAGILSKITTLSYFPYTRIIDYYDNLQSNNKRKPFLLNTRLRFIRKDTGNFVSLNDENKEDPFWAEVYDGRLGKVVFGHEAFSQVQYFDHAFGIEAYIEEKSIIANVN